MNRLDSVSFGVALDQNSAIIASPWVVEQGYPLHSPPCTSVVWGLNLLLSSIQLSHLVGSNKSYNVLALSLVWLTYGLHLFLTKYRTICITPKFCKQLWNSDWWRKIYSPPGSHCTWRSRVTWDSVTMWVAFAIRPHLPWYVSLPRPTLDLSMDHHIFRSMKKLANLKPTAWISHGVRDPFVAVNHW